ncbi:MAG: 4'-phosphopantetheinyl transferase superfamily protein [Candidatus Korobacteraceae bacterium]
METLKCIELGPDDVHIWRARLDVGSAVLRGLARTLAPNEIERTSQFRFLLHRNLFVAARGILRHILSGYMQTAPQALLLRSTAKGKLFLADKCGVHFNVSHSGTLALYAVARHEVGIDIERIDARLATPDVAMRVFTSRELAEWYALPASERSRVFFDCWTRKEAYLKGRAEGLSLPLSELEVWSAGGEFRVLFSDGQMWALRSLKPTGEYSAAVAVEGGRASVKCLDFWLSDGVRANSGVAPELKQTAIPG